MKGCLPICALLLALCAIGWTMEIGLANNPSVQVCPDETVTFVCNITGTTTHLWTISSTMVTNEAVSTGLDLPTIAGFEFSADNTSAGVVTTVQFRVTMSHTITCINAGNFNIKEITDVTLFGNASVPRISNVTSVTYDELLAFLTIERPVNNSQCVREYSVLVSSGTDTITVPVRFTEPPLPTMNVYIGRMNVTTFDPCNESYTFRVQVANSEEQSEPLQGNFNFNKLGTPVGSVMNKDIGVEVTDPKPLQNCTVQSYNYICGDMSGIIDFSNPIPLMDFNNCTCNVTLTPIIAVQSAPLITSSFNVDICREATTMISTPITSTATTATTGGTPITDPSSSPLLIIIIVVVVVVVLIVVIIIIIVVVVLCCRPRPSPTSKDETDGAVMMYKQDQTKATSRDAMPTDAMPTYQDPQTIQREAAGPSGDVYTVVAKEKKGSKKKGQSEELPMYSMVDKSAQKQEGLVYAEVDVQNSRSSRSRRPPAPPGVVQHDANEPVLYSTVDNTKH